MAPLYLIATIYPRMDRAADVERILRGMMASTLAEAGCELYDLVVDPQAPDRWVMLEKWTSREHWDAHMLAPHNVDGNAQLAELLRQPTDLLLLDPK